MNKKALASLETRNKLLDAAMNVIRAQGYAATTVDDICEAAGVTKGSFFHHFKSKEALAVATAEHFSAMAHGLFSAAPFCQAADPLERLLGYIDFRKALIQGEACHYTCLLGTLVQETYDTHPAIRQACGQHLEAHIEWVSKCIAEAKAHYVPQAPWAPESLAAFTQATLQGAFILAKATQEPQSAIQCLDHLREYIVTLFSPEHLK